MSENYEDNTELTSEELSRVSGGMEVPEGVAAKCRKCHELAEPLYMRKEYGALVTYLRCKTEGCSEFGIEKNNLHFDVL
ncbi:MAG: hypothetical protein IKP95_11300 [Ruminococcus sp.]|nr:hypothetical protein [Ruminococcus sp.]